MGDDGGGELGQFVSADGADLDIIAGDGIHRRDLRCTASKERAESGASEYELASSTGHSIEAGAQILDTYNPGSFKAAKSAQAKRLKARFSGGKKNGQETKKAKKFENPSRKSLKA